MSIKNILVAYNGTASSDAAVGLGLLMATKYDAHLTGALVHGMPATLANAGVWLPDSLQEDFAEIVARTKKEVYGGIAARFAELTEGKGAADRIHWLDVAGTPDAALVEIARRFDITLLGKYAPVPGENQLVLHPDLVALQSGRPVLIVPEGFAVEALGDHAVLAWDGKRAAARALADAMKILETKTLVTVLVVGDDGVREGPTGATLALQLERHGIPARRVTVPRKGSIGATIADWCAASGAGLLVMGAYEHSKFSEDLIGGVTNDVFDRITIPVLMSH
jgi:nucleotide-binding universal stress UspA family protein